MADTPLKEKNRQIHDRRVGARRMQENGAFPHPVIQE
jgi:hypothetical protein